MCSERLVLNLGCGEEMYGTHRVDINMTSATTHVFDVEKGINFQGDMFHEIYSRNLLEHLRNVGFFLDECYRVLKKGGKITLITDNAECVRYYWFGTHTGRYEELHEPNDRHYEIFTKNHLFNHFVVSGFHVESIEYIETDTSGRFFDMLTLNLLGRPRIKVVATK